MIKQNFVIICESAIVEKDTQNLYILGIFENVFTPGVPAIQPKFCVVTNFEGGTGSHVHKIVIRDGSGIELISLEGNITFSITKRANYIGKFIGYKFPNFGKYTIEIYLDDTLQPQTTSLNVVEAKTTS